MLLHGVPFFCVQICSFALVVGYDILVALRSDFVGEVCVLVAVLYLDLFVLPVGGSISFRICMALAMYHVLFQLRIPFL